MNNEIYFYAIVLLIMYGYFYLEASNHEKNLRKLPLRIHVNGTRGKSSVTRLIAAGLGAGGYKVFGKTTGTEAKIIFPDRSEQYIKRKGPANIIENVKVIKQAVACGANAIVVECMAINPELQRFCEKRLIKSHIGVITNIRADHEDVMGDGLESIAIALSNAIPENGELVTTQEARTLLEPVAGGRKMIVVAGEQLDATYLQGFGYEIIPDNVAIALRVCELAGVEAVVAIDGMRKATADAGNLTITELMIGNKTVVIVNALAANDPESTLWLWNHRMPLEGRKVVLLNCRSDRQDRTAKLCKMLSTVHKGSFIVAGDRDFTSSLLKKLCKESGEVYCLSDKPQFSELKLIIEKCSEDRIIIFAAGNMKGLPQEFMGKLNGG